VSDDLPPGAAPLRFDGVALHAGGDGGPGRRFEVDARCLAGAPVAGAYAHVCALASDRAALRFDEPEIQQARRDALAWWIALVGADLVCLTTLALDASRYGGAITVTRRPVDWSADPFARIFPGTVVRSDLFCEVAPPPGPVIERYAGVAWPGGRF
jgi:hypothetical protein